MRIFRILRRFALIGVLIGLAFPVSAPSAGSPLSAVTLPEEIGTIVSRSAPPGAEGPTPAVFLIEDSLPNEVSQSHVTKILQYLQTTYGVDLLFVETPVPGKKSPYLQYRTRTQSSVGNWHIVEIDEPRAYREGVSPLLYHEGTKSQVPEALSELTGDLREYAGHRLSPLVQELIAQQKAYRRGSKDLEDWMNALSQMAHRIDINWSQFPQIQRYQRLQTYEAAIDDEVFIEERSELIKKLSPQLDEAEHNELMQLLYQFRVNYIDLLTYLQQFKFLSDRKAISWKKHAPQMKLRHDYLLDRVNLDVRALMSEIDELVYQVKLGLAASEKERALIDLLDRMERYLRLFNLNWTPQDDEFFRRYQNRFAMVPIALKLPEIYEPHRKTFIAADTLFLDVYDYFERPELRVKPMVFRCMETMAARSAGLAAFLAYNRHSRSIAGEFLNRGFSVIVIAPHITAIEKGQELL